MTNVVPFKKIVSKTKIKNGILEKTDTDTRTRTRGHGQTDSFCGQFFADSFLRTVFCGQFFADSFLRTVFCGQFFADSYERRAVMEKTGVEHLKARFLVERPVASPQFSLS